MSTRHLLYRSYPDNEFAILSAGDQMPLVGAPVQADHLGVVALETLPDLDVELVNARHIRDVRHLLQRLVPDLLPLLRDLGLDHLDLVLQ